MKYIKTGKVSSLAIDATRSLSAIGMFQYTEEGVTELLGEMELDGFSIINKYNATWVFIKNRVVLYKPLEWNEEFTLESFISKISMASIIIDVALRNKGGEICAYSRVELVAIDMENMHIRKTKTVGMDEQVETHTSLKDISFTKFSKKELSEIGTAVVKYTNLDYQHHTNNKEYIRFILDTYKLEDMLERPIKEMEILYVSQSHEGDQLSISKDIIDDRETFVISKENDVVIKAELIR